MSFYGFYGVGIVQFGVRLHLSGFHGTLLGDEL